MRVYRAVESRHDRRVKQVENFVIGMCLLFIGIVLGALLALFIAEHYLDDVINPNATVPLSAFCSGLVPEPIFCNEMAMSGLYVRQSSGLQHTADVSSFEPKVSDVFYQNAPNAVQGSL